MKQNMPASLLDYYKRVSTYGKNVENHILALFMIHHYKTRVSSLEFVRPFQYYLYQFEELVLLILQFVLLVCLMCSVAGERKTKLETAVDI